MTTTSNTAAAISLSPPYPTLAEVEATYIKHLIETKKLPVGEVSIILGVDAATLYRKRVKLKMIPAPTPLGR